MLNNNGLVPLDLGIYALDDYGPDYMQNLPIDEDNYLFFAESISKLLNDKALNPHATRHLTSERALTLLLDGPNHGICTLKVSLRNKPDSLGFNWRLDSEETFTHDVLSPIAMPILDHLLSLPANERTYFYLQSMIGISKSHEYRAMLWFAQKLLGIGMAPELFLFGLWNGNQAKFADFMTKLDAAILAEVFPESNPNAIFDPVYVSRLLEMYRHVFQDEPHLSNFTIEQRPTAYFEGSDDGQKVLPVIATAFMKYAPTSVRVSIDNIESFASTFHKK